MKMWSKIIFFVATLCVVNASVININVFDDQTGAVLGDGVEDCNWRACDQLCRRLGFPSGTCINGRCKCDNFRGAEEDLQTVVDSEDDYSLQSCNNQECDQRCRRLKFRGGVCVNGRCKCDNYRGAEAFAAVIEDYLALSSCNPQECYQRCRRLKFPSGTCINGRCKCDNFRSADDSVLNSQAIISVGCNYRVCNERCQQLGFAGGVCVNDHCICKKVKHVKDSDFELEDSVSPRSCDLSKCQQVCMRIGYRGVCVGGRCQCISRGAEGVVIQNTDSISDASDYRRVRNCNPQICITLCRFLRYKSGTCVNGNCQCSRNEESTNSTTQQPGPERKEESNPVDTLNTSNNEVQESNLIQNESKFEDSSLKLERSVQPRSCNFQECQKRCTRLGFYPVCSNGRCKCYTSRPEKANPVNNEIEESNLIPNEDESVEGHYDRVARATCYQFSCNDRCLRVGYVGGLCKKNKCKCY